MVGRKRGDIAASLTLGRERFETWRQTRKLRARIPDKLWSLPGEHGGSRTDSILELDYDCLKKRVQAKDADSASGSGTFIELAPPSPASSRECVVEFEDGSGARMRVQLQGCDSPGLIVLGCRFWVDR